MEERKPYILEQHKGEKIMILGLTKLLNFI